MQHKWLTAVAVAGVLMLSPALAQEGMEEPATQPPAGQPAGELDRAAATGLLVIGKEVYSGRDEKIGKVKEVIQDEQGNVEAIVLDIGGIAGVGKKKVAIPASQLAVEGGRIIVPSMNRQQILKLPSYR